MFELGLFDTLKLKRKNCKVFLLLKVLRKLIR